MTQASPEIKSTRSSAFLYINYGILLVMMACLAYVLLQLVDWVLPQVVIFYLLPFSFFVSLEAVLSTHGLFWEDNLSPRRLSFRIVEWIVLIVLAKILSYIPTGFNRLAADLLLWEDRFSSFFTTEFIISLILTLVIWILTSHITDYLLNLFSSREQLDIEMEGLVLIDRPKLRRGLSGLIFFIGGVMLAIMTLFEFQSKLFPVNDGSVNIPFGVVLLFFICGLFLLSQTQLYILWSRWYKRQIPTSPKIWTRWIGLSVMLIAAGALIASLLPTDYSMGLLQILQSVFGYLLYLLAFLQYLLFLPFLSLLRWFANLFNSQPLDLKPPVNPLPQPMAPIGEPLSQPVWMELLRSIFFWTIFFTVIFFGFRHYFQQNKEIIETLRKQPYLQWIFQFIGWLRSLFKQVTKWTETVITKTQRGIRKTHIHISARLPKVMPVFAKLPPRIRIRLIYLLMTEWIGAQGFPRHSNQTPGEYANHLIANFPELCEDIHQITDLFISSRYSQAQITAAQARTVHKSWKSLQAAWRSKFEANTAPRS